MTRSSLWRCLSPLLLMVAFCAYASAATTPPPTPLNLPALSFTTLLGSGWTFADLDGDHQPDFARGRSVDRGGGNVYRVDVSLTGGLGTRFLTFKNPDALEVNLDAMDVDGDNDLDLVVTSRFFGQNIGVWINDGNGSFSRSTSPAYPERLKGPSVGESLPSPAVSLIAGSFPRAPGLVRVGFVPPEVRQTRPADCILPACVLEFESRAHQLRAPPALLS